MNKKILAAIMAVALLTLGLAGCASNKDAAATANEEKYEILAEELATEEYGIGFRKGDALCEQVNAALQVLKANGTVEEISTEWFGEDITIIEADASALDDIEIEAGRTLIMGLDDSFPPMGYRDSTNEIIGFDIDLAQAVCDHLGWTLKLQQIDWSAKEMELESKNIDCIWNGMTLTEERMESMSCTAPYLANSQILVVMADSGITSLDDLAGKSIALQTGSSAEDALDGAESFKESLGSFYTYSNNLECFMDLEQGGVDAVLVDSIVADWYITTGNAD